MVLRLTALFRLPPDADVDPLLVRKLFDQDWSRQEIEAVEGMICNDPELAKDAKWGLTPALFASARQKMREESRRAAPNRATCKRCGDEPEWIYGTGLGKKCKVELDKQQADAELADAKPLEWNEDEDRSGDSGTGAALFRLATPVRGDGPGDEHNP